MKRIVFILNTVGVGEMNELDASKINTLSLP